MGRAILGGMTSRVAAAKQAGYVVRDATPADADGIGAVHVGAWRETYPGMIAQEVIDSLDERARAARWREWLEQPGSPLRVVVGVDPGGTIVGMLCLGPNRDDDSPAEQEVWAVNVLDSAKGTGLADALLDEAVGPDPASMWVLQENRRARAFYARHGFAPDGRSIYDERLQATQVRLVRGR